MFRVLLIVASLLSQNSFAQQNIVSTQGNTTPQPNDNVAVVTWTGFDGLDFIQTSVLMDKLFCDSDGAFCVKQENYFTIDMGACFPEDFADKFKGAVDKIKDKKNPILIVALSSHGGEGFIASQAEPGFILYFNLISTLFKNSFEINKDITLMLFVDACHSGSIIPIIQKKLSCTDSKETCYEGTDGANYKNKILVYTAAPSDEVGWGIDFWDSLNKVSKQEDCKNKESCGLNDKGISTFISSKEFNDYVIWSSFSKKNEKLLSSNSDKKGLQTEIKYYINILKNGGNAYVRAKAARTLREIAPPGDKEVIDALNYVTKNDADEGVRKTANEVLAEIDPKNDENSK